MCKVNYALFREMAAVVVAAEKLVDVAGTEAVTEEVAAEGANLAQVVKTYRTTAKRFEPRGETNVLH
jgi:adenine deaminase